MTDLLFPPEICPGDICPFTLDVQLIGPGIYAISLNYPGASSSFQIEIVGGVIAGMGEGEIDIGFGPWPCTYQIEIVFSGTPVASSAVGTDNLTCTPPGQGPSSVITNFDVFR